MLRLATPGYQRFIQSTSLGASFGGGEANVAVSLVILPQSLSRACRKMTSPGGASRSCVNTTSERAI